jgi:hypothetical protein
VLGTFTFLTSTGGIGLFTGNNDNATGDWYPWQPDLERHRPGVFAGSAVEVDRAAREEAVEWIRANPGRAARLYLEKLRLIVVQDTLAADWAIFAEGISPPAPGVPVVPGPHPLKGHRRGALRFLRAAGVLLASFAFGGAFLLLRAAVHDGRRPRGAVFAALFATALYLALVSALIAVNGRYRWPLEDLAVPLAAVAIARVRPARPAMPDDTLMLHS